MHFLISFFSSCKKNEIDLHQIRDSVLIRHFDIRESLQNIAVLLSIPHFDNNLKKNIDLSSVNYFSDSLGDRLWIASLKPGSFGFSKAKIAVSLKRSKVSMIITSYEYDTTLYKKGNRSTYSGKISIFNEERKLIEENDFKLGVLTRIKRKSCSNCSIIVIVPDQGGGDWSDVDWCSVLPPLCDYNGGEGNSNFGSPAYLMMDPGGDVGGGSGGELNGPSIPPFVWSYKIEDDDGTIAIDNYPNNSPTFQFLSSDNYEVKYPRFTELVKNLKSFVMSNRMVLSALKKWSDLTQENILAYLSFGQGPIIKIGEMNGALGYFNAVQNPAILNIKKYYVDALETSPFSIAREELAFLLSVTVLHEFIHFSTNLNGVSEGAYEFGSGFELEAFNVIVTTDNLGKVFLKFAKYF